METASLESSITPAPSAALPAAGKPELVYLLSQFPTVTHTYLLREVKELRKQGINLLVFSIRPTDRPMDQLEEDEQQEARPTRYVVPVGLGRAAWIHLRVLASRPGSYLGGLVYSLQLSKWNFRSTFMLLLYFAEAVIVGDWMEKAGCRHVHTHFASTVALIVCKVFPVTFSMTIHGPDELEMEYYMREKLRVAQFAFAISNYARSQMMRSSPPEHWGKITVSPLGVNPNIYTPAVRHERNRQFQLICVARLNPVKAQTVLLEAVAQVIAGGRSMVLNLVGDGPDRGRLESKVKTLGISQFVIFHGAKPQPEVVPLVQSADAFVLASFAEGVPVALMEAMALETPVIATGITGVPELIRSGLDGLLVAPSDVGGLARAIETLMDDPELRARLARSGRNRVCEYYDITKNAARLAQMFREQLAGDSS